jgi:phosphoribosylaminoimidazolecarboxamide formyltransferase/IMP cyclohydrolase
MKRRALISVADKSGALEFGKNLVEMGWEILSSSGTAKMFRDAGVPVIEVSDITKFPHILGGRVKTLHPLVFGGILARRDLDSDVKDMEDHGITGIDLVAVNLYPFEKTARSGADLDALIENIDIGGVALIRAAAKNYRYVTVLTEPADYAKIIEELRAEGSVTLETRRKLALKAFDTTARYDATIGAGLRREMGEPLSDDQFSLALVRKQELRYGENPHQKASIYLPPLSDFPVTQLAGKELSYNNLLDLDTAMRATAMMQDSIGAVVIKHTTPCGMALGRTVAEAYDRAFACDSLSAFGGVVGVTRHIDLATAESISKHFTEVLLCPSIDEDALQLLTSKRKNLRIMTWKGGRVFEKQMVTTWCGMLMEDDKLAPLPDQSEGHWIGTPRPDLWNDLVFAWKVAAVSKSNAVAMVKDGEAVGIGMGFCSRVFAVEFAAHQAGEKAKGAVMASDAFFPFPDGVEKAAAAGVVAIIQPGGSVRDEEVAKRAQELGVSMFISGHRTFRH